MTALQRLNNVTFSQLAPFNPDTPQPPTLLGSLDPVYYNPLSYQYSAGLQYQAARDTVIELNYVGSHQIHQGRNRNINQIPYQDLLAAYDGSINPDLYRPYLGYSQLYVNGRDATTRYNSLQVFANRRFTSGLEFQVAYTWSRLISSTINRDTEGQSFSSAGCVQPQSREGAGEPGPAADLHDELHLRAAVLQKKLQQVRQGRRLADGRWWASTRRGRGFHRRSASITTWSG